MKPSGFHFDAAPFGIQSQRQLADWCIAIGKAGPGGQEFENWGNGSFFEFEIYLGTFSVFLLSYRFSARWLSQEIVH